MYYDALLILAGGVDAAGVLQAELFSALGATAGINAVDTELDMPSTAYTSQAQARDFGRGQTVPVNVRVVQAPVGSASIAFEIVGADDPDFTTNLMRLTRSIALPSLTNGVRLLVGDNGSANRWRRVA